MRLVLGEQVRRDAQHAHLLKDVVQDGADEDKFHAGYVVELLIRSSADVGNVVQTNRGAEHHNQRRRMAYHSVLVSAKCNPDAVLVAEIHTC